MSMLLLTFHIMLCHIQFFTRRICTNTGVYNSISVLKIARLLLGDEILLINPLVPDVH